MSEHAEAIVARLMTAGDPLPDTLREAALGLRGSEPPSLIVESAEGVTSFGGFNGHPGTPRAEEWMARRLADIGSRNEPLGPAPSLRDA